MPTDAGELRARDLDYVRNYLNFFPIFIMPSCRTPSGIHCEGEAKPLDGSRIKPVLSLSKGPG